MTIRTDKVPSVNPERSYLEVDTLLHEGFRISQSKHYGQMLPSIWTIWAVELLKQEFAHDRRFNVFADRSGRMVYVTGNFIQHEYLPRVLACLRPITQLLTFRRDESDAYTTVWEIPAYNGITPESLATVRKLLTDEIGSGFSLDATDGRLKLEIITVSTDVAMTMAEVAALIERTVYTVNREAARVSA